MRSRIIAAVVLFLFAPFSARAEGPEATFTLENGFLSIRIIKEDRSPLPCKLKIFLPNGQLWAEGETDENGRVECPKPNTLDCRVEFNHGGEPVPPILVQFIDEGKSVVPLIAPLTPGPCCKPKSAEHHHSISQLSATEIGAICIVVFLPLIAVWWQYQKDSRACARPTS